METRRNQDGSPYPRADKSTWPMSMVVSPRSSLRFSAPRGDLDEGPYSTGRTLSCQCTRNKSLPRGYSASTKHENRPLVGFTYVTAATSRRTATFPALEGPWLDLWYKLTGEFDGWMRFRADSWWILPSLMSRDPPGAEFLGALTGILEPDP